MSEAVRDRWRTEIERLVKTASVLALLILLGLVGFYWSEGIVPRWVFWEAGLVLLLAAEIAYGIAVVCAATGVLVFGLLLCKRRLKHARAPAVARWFLLCGSLLSCLFAADVVSAFWQYQRHRRTALPVGGSARPESRASSGEEIRPGKDVALPTAFPAKGDDAAIEVVILGDSSAEGVPYDRWLSLGRILEWQLENLLPGRDVRVLTLATAGSTLAYQHANLAKIRRRPDLLIVYCGHNEFTARLPASRAVRYYLDDDLRTVEQELASWLEEMSPLCGLIRETADTCKIAIPPPASGYRTLVDAPAFTTWEFQTLLADFRRRLEVIVSYAQRLGALTVLISPAGNDADYEPNRSFLPETTPRALRAAFARDFASARRAEAGDPAIAISAFRALLGKEPVFAETHYRLARLLARTGQWDEAYAHFVAARDLDGYPARLLTSFQDIYRQTAARHNCILIDSQDLFHSLGPRGLLDDHLFHDGVHPSLRGQLALAQAVLQALKERRAFGWPEQRPAAIVDPALCAEHFGMRPRDWFDICLWGIMFYDRTQGMRYDPAGRLRKKDAFARAAERIRAGAAPESVGLPNVGIPPPVPLLPAAEPEGKIRPNGNAAAGFAPERPRRGRRPQLESRNPIAVSSIAPIPAIC